MAAGVSSAVNAAGASGTGAAAGVDRKSIAQNFDAFLLLLTTQLKNQNPMEPLDTNQFTQQLVQFASVEQQIKSNESLNALIATSQSSVMSNVAGFVGMQVTADGATSRLSGGRAEWRLNAARDVPQATITIRDKEGNVVATDTRSLQAGAQTYRWNGMTSTGLPAPDGDYTITATGTGASGQGVSVKTEVSGRVDGVDLTGDVPVLLIGNLRVLLPNVRSISEGAGL